MIQSLNRAYLFLNENYAGKMKVVRFVISGGTATLVNVLSLYIFTDLMGIYYVISAILSYITSFIVSFSMQKYWTFKENSSINLRSQAIYYFLVTLFNLGLNALFIYLLVQYASFHYLLAQIVISLLIAIESFFVYKYIFRTKRSEESGLNSYDINKIDQYEIADNYSKNK